MSCEKIATSTAGREVGLGGRRRGLLRCNWHIMQHVDLCPAALIAHDAQSDMGVDGERSACVTAVVMQRTLLGERQHVALWSDDVVVIQRRSAWWQEKKTSCNVWWAAELEGGEGVTRAESGLALKV
jgi:hypothetical protein